MSLPFDLYRRQDATGLAALIARGEVSATELLELALARMEATDPQFHFMATRAEAQAREAIALGLPKGPFQGVPFLLKDIGAEAVAYPAHLGSHLLRNTVYERDSTLFRRLRATGLVPFGRTTVPEGALGVATEAAVYGGPPTRNPWNPDLSPGGSSGGAAAAIAAGVVPAAHGSDGGGSLRIPASNCGLFAFKATRARLPDGPDAGESWAGLAIEGFLTRSTRDMANLLDATHGPDPGAPYVAPPLPHSFATARTRPPGPLRVALCDTDFDGRAVDPACADAARATAKLLEGMGHVVTPARPQADHQGMMRAWTQITACGTAQWVRARLTDLGRDLQPGDLEPVATSAFRLGEGISGPTYLAAVEAIHSYGRAMAGFFERYDVLVTPTLAEPPAQIGRFAHHWDDYWTYRMGADGVFAYSPYCAAFNATGQPAASVPLAWKDGVPIGVHLAMGFGEDARLMSLCAALEQAAPWFDRVPGPPI